MEEGEKTLEMNHEKVGFGGFFSSLNEVPGLLILRPLVYSFGFAFENPFRFSTLSLGSRVSITRISLRDSFFTFPLGFYTVALKV